MAPSRSLHASSRSRRTTSRRPHTTPRRPHTTPRSPHTTSRRPHANSRQRHTTSRCRHTTSRRRQTGSRYCLMRKGSAVMASIQTASLPGEASTIQTGCFTPSPYRSLSNAARNVGVHSTCARWVFRATVVASSWVTSGVERKWNHTTPRSPVTSWPEILRYPPALEKSTTERQPARRSTSSLLPRACNYSDGWRCQPVPPLTDEGGHRA
jgi:hypothetical protein